MKLTETIKLIEEIRNYEDLKAFQTEKTKEICKKYNISESQLNFLILTVAAERMKKQKIL